MMWLGIFSLVLPMAQASIIKLPIKAQDHVKMTFSKAQINLVGAKDNFLTLNSSSGCRDLQTETHESEYSIHESAPLKTQGESHCVVQVSLPSTNLQLHVLDGGISAQKLGGDLLLHAQKGKVILKDSSGSAMIHVQRGEVQVTDFQGRLRLDLLQANAVVKDLQGDLDLQSLGGDHQVEKAHGNLRITQTQGSTKVTGGAGSLQIETGRSTLNLQGFSGRIEGQTQEGNIQLQLANDPDVNLKSKSGRIVLQAPAGSGASVNLVTQEGDLSGPSFLQVSREGSTKTIRGRLRGETGKGSLIVRSQDGSIILK